MYFGVAVAFFVGCAFGSFLNVIAFRYNTGMSFIGGRSFCFSCGRRLAWYELIPIFSFLALKGACRTCKSKISFQYPLVELISGVVFGSLYAKIFFSGVTAASVSDFLLSAAIFAILIVIAIYDMKHKIIPDDFVYAFMILALMRGSILLGISGFSPAGLSALISGGPSVALPLFLLWIVSRGRWIGFGDVKLSLGIGWLLGPLYGFSALIVGFWSGALFGLSIMGYQRLVNVSNGLKMKSEVPFGPFLIFGATLVYFYSIDVLGISRLLSL